MTVLVTSDWVKDRFPTWSTYCTREDNLKTPDEMLQLAIDDATGTFVGFMNGITVLDMTDELNGHLLHMVKFNCFNFLHGNTTFKNDPLIVKEYKHSIELLEKGIISFGTADNTKGHVRFKTRDRQFDDSFLTNPKEWYE